MMLTDTDGCWMRPEGKANSLKEAKTQEFPTSQDVPGCCRDAWDPGGVDKPPAE